LNRARRTTTRPAALRGHALTLSRRHPATTLVFRLGRGGLVRFSVRDLVCGTVRSFAVPGHTGVNRVRFSGRVGGRRLRAGSYRIRGRSHGRTVFRRRLVVGDGGPSCGSGPGGSATRENGSTGLTGVSAGTSGKGSSQRADSRAAAGRSATPHASGAGVLGAQISRILPGSRRTQLALLAILALAIFLLALGALPRQLVPHPGAAALLVQRRALIALAGLTALAAFLVSYFVA
jgi:hypothetical protein